MDPARLQDVQRRRHPLDAARDVRERNAHLHPAGKTAKPHNTTHWASLLMSMKQLFCSYLIKQSPLLRHFLLGMDSTCTTFSERWASWSRCGGHNRSYSCCREMATG